VECVENIIMAEFVKGNQLNAELEKIFENAKEQLVLISPFIKLHSRFIDALKSKKNAHKLNIVVVFGKNENNLSESFSKSEFNFLKEFPNIEIKYESRLHAKYYANESTALLSSMNLYEYSQNNNIEFGILTKSSILGLGTLTGNLLGDKIDDDSYKYFNQVIDNSELMFKKAPVFSKGIISKKYSHSEVEVDKLSEKLTKKAYNSKPSKKAHPKKKETMGYCIRTGVKIPFNPDRPLSDKAFKSWSKFKDKDYAEKYCHYSGESSNGETYFGKPILKKNWSKAKSLIK
jgi:PLD-like domain